MFNKHLLSVSHVVQFLSHRHSVRDSAISGITIPVIRLLHLLKLTGLAGPREELPKQRHVSGGSRSQKVNTRKSIIAGVK